MLSPAPVAHCFGAPGMKASIVVTSTSVKVLHGVEKWLLDACMKEPGS